MNLRLSFLARQLHTPMVMLVILICSFFPARASSTAPTIQITSPIHPRTFYLIGNPKMAQDLIWEKKDGTLTGEVTYSLVMGGGDELFDPANYETFELPFPSVHLGPKNSLYVKRVSGRIFVGHLEEGAFGTQVRLNRNVHFTAHRQDGELSGTLVIALGSD